MMKNAQKRRKWRTRNIEMSKYLHLLSSNYLKNIVKIKIKYFFKKNLYLNRNYYVVKA